MSTAVDSPIIVLFEDRPKQGMVFQLNLSIYLDARVVQADSLKDLKKALASPDGIHLVITRSQFKGAPFAEKARDFLSASNSTVPVVCLGDAKEGPGLVVVGTDSEVKPMLQAAAKLLGITAKQMVSKQRSDTYEIAPDFLNLLFTCPCDVFDRGVNGLDKVFSAGEPVPRAKIERFARDNRPLVIDSYQRLKLANAVTEQALKATEELANDKLPVARKMGILSASLDMVAAQFQNAGMDEETVKLANASIKAVEKIAENATSVGSLVKALVDAHGGYRYAHCQLITFLGFHVIKMMGWWGDDQRSIISQAAFYHDITLNTDETAMVRTAKAAADLVARDPSLSETLLSHAQLAARELQSAPEISPEVVRVVIQHHGTAMGKGFSTDIAKLDPLSKTFILAEEWGDYLIELAINDRPANNDAKVRELKGIYKDDQSQQIIETFRYLDPEAFMAELLHDKEIEYATNLVSGGEAESVVVPMKPAEAEPETVVSGGAGQAEEEIRVKGGKAEAEEEIVVKGGKEKKDDTVRTVRASREPKLADVVNVKGPAGDKARALMEKIKEKKPDASPEEVETLLKAGGVTVPEEMLVSGEEEAGDPEKTVKGVTQHIEDEDILVSGKEEAAEESDTTVKGVTDHIEHEEIRVKGSAAEEEAKKKIAGVTDVRKDEVVVIKGEKPKDLYDKSITRIKADPQEKERELKMKALAGSTDFMKAALAGAIDKATEILTTTPTELRKTDSEGRTAIHYAAMGGHVAMIKFLAEKGSPLNGVDSKRRSPLYLAALYRKNDAFDFLLGQGSKIAQQAMGGMTIAMVAASNSNMHVLKLAVQKGVRLDAKDHNGLTALDYAKKTKNAESIAYLEAASKPAPAEKAGA